MFIRGICCSDLDLDLDPVRLCLSAPLVLGDAVVGELGGLDRLEEFLEDLPDDVRAKLLGTPSACIPADIPCGEIYLKLLPLLFTVPAMHTKDHSKKNDRK